MIEQYEVVRRGDVRRAKLYYLRDLRGKASKIKERRNADGSNIIEPTIAKVVTPVVEAVVEAPAAVEAVAEEATTEQA